MRGEPFILVTCNGCDEEFEASLTSLAGGAWDERGVDGQLKRAGWTKDGDRDLCSDCSEGGEE